MIKDTLVSITKDLKLARNFTRQRRCVLAG